MINEQLEEYLRNQGYQVDNLLGKDQKPYIVIRNYSIPAGSLSGQTCDVGIERTSSIPYIAPAAIHTYPALVRMDMSSHLRTQASGIGPDWQYWSRILRVPPSPRAFLIHIATIFSEV